MVVFVVLSGVGVPRPPLAAPPRRGLGGCFWAHVGSLWRPPIPGEVGTRAAALAVVK